MRTPWESWLCVVSTPPFSTSRTSARHSSSDRRSPACSAVISSDTRSSPGLRRRSSTSFATYASNSSAARSSSSRRVITAIASNCCWSRLESRCSSAASSSGAPTTVAIMSAGYGLAKSRTKSQLPRSATWLPELLQEPAHRGPVLVRRLRRERRLHERAQPRVLLAAERQDVARQRAAQRPVRDAEQVEHVHARELRLAWSAGRSPPPRGRARRSRSRTSRSTSARAGPASSRGSGPRAGRGWCSRTREGRGP